MGEARRGHLRIFLGMAAGVGKTFRMLIEGHAEQEAGRDVVIGLMESHGRAQTAELAEGLLWIPPRRVLYRGTTLEEMDLPAILIRAPELCLVDELAHSNAPAVEHAKRYEDVEDMLTAGIDVLSTLNVQHLESLNDQIAEFSGLRVRETMPDAVLGRADEIVLVDLPPEALLDRLRAGKIYRPERIDPALNNVFKLENLAALREVALRQVALEVGHKGLTTIDPVSSRDDSIAAGAPLTDAEDRSLTALRRLASMLGAPLLVDESDNVPGAIADVARRQGSTYLLMGPSRPRRGLARLRTPLPQRLMELLPRVDVRVVADRSHTPEGDR
jgi:two-component system sensor histidine kinase KdpD